MKNRLNNFGEVSTLSGEGQIEVFSNVHIMDAHHEQNLKPIRQFAHNNIWQAKFVIAGVHSCACGC